MDQPTPEKKYREELLLSRTVLRNEMRRASHAYSPAERRELVKTWNEVYEPKIARELLRVARNKEAMYRIANWNLGEFDKERRGGKR
jgi:hypothetical protein